MGRIQRQPAQAQVDFLRVCCQYWKNEGNYSIEDAKLECMDTYDTLVKYKIIKEQNGHIQIDFLDEQLDVVELKRQQASEAGKRSAETRKRKTKGNDRSTAVQQSFNDRSTEFNREEKSRVEKSREDEENNSPTLFDIFWKVYDFNVGLRQAQDEWMRITKEMPNEIPKIMANVPLYVASKQDKNFRKKPENYLKERVWMDEIVTTVAPNTNSDSELSDEELSKLSYDEIRKVKDKQMRVRYCDLKGIKEGGFQYSNIVELNNIAF